jgi:hypothetical protein
MNEDAFTCLGEWAILLDGAGDAKGAAKGCIDFLVALLEACPNLPLSELVEIANLDSGTAGSAHEVKARVKLKLQQAEMRSRSRLHRRKPSNNTPPSEPEELKRRIAATTRGDSGASF